MTEFFSLATTDGSVIDNVNEIKHHQRYVALGPGQTFAPAEYPPVLLGTRLIKGENGEDRFVDVS